MVPAWGRRPRAPLHEVAQPRPGEVHQGGRRLAGRGGGGGVGPGGQRLGGADQGLGEACDLTLGEVGVAVGLPGRDHDQLRHERDDLLAHRGDLGRERFAGTGLEVQHRPAVRVLPGVREERPQPFPELAVGRHVGPYAGPDRLHQRSRLPADAGGEQVFLRVQVQIDQRLGHARQFGDLVHRRGHVSALPEGPHGGVDHLLLTHRARHPLGLHGTHGARVIGRPYSQPPRT